MKTEQPSFPQFSRLTFSQTLSEIKPRKPLSPYLPFTQLSFAKKAILSLLSSPPPPPCPRLCQQRARFDRRQRSARFKNQRETRQKPGTHVRPRHIHTVNFFFILSVGARAHPVFQLKTPDTLEGTRTHSLTHARALPFSPSILLSFAARISLVTFRRALVQIRR